MSHMDAVEELTRNAGTQLDPRVVEALLGVLSAAGSSTRPESAPERLHFVARRHGQQRLDARSLPC
jgi:HD-GYP domain-containing protein (c-di-GMP phosphodiesterase class II)